MYMHNRVHAPLSIIMSILFISFTLVFLFAFFVPDLEWYMASNGIVTDSELEEDPRARGVERNQVMKSTSHSYAVDSDDDL